MKTNFFYTFVLMALLASACAPSAAAQPLETATPPEVQEEAGAAPVTSPEPAVLLFAIGMHIEPLGETAQDTKAARGIIASRNSLSIKSRIFSPSRRSLKRTAGA